MKGVFGHVTDPCLLCNGSGRIDAIAANCTCGDDEMCNRCAMTEKGDFLPSMRVVVKPADGSPPRIATATREQDDEGNTTSDAGPKANKNTPIPAKQGEVQPGRSIVGNYDLAQAIEALYAWDRPTGGVAARLGKALAAPPLDEWQPIEDAPECGQFVATDGRRAVIVDWRDGRWACTYGGGIEPRQITHFKPIGNLPNTEMENPNG
jgi:hypothetical protein